MIFTFLTTIISSSCTTALWREAGLRRRLFHLCWTKATLW